MKCDRELCMAAVTRDWFAFEHASNDMKRDEACVLQAMDGHLTKNPRLKGNMHKSWLWGWLPKEMKHNERVRSVAGMKQEAPSRSSR